MEKKSLGRGLDDISDIFLSTRKDKQEDKNKLGGFSSDSDNTEIKCEIEEDVIVRRNIAYPNTPYAQQDILKSLSKHLEENYSVKRIELRKTDRISQPGIKKSIEERITIYIYGGARRL